MAGEQATFRASGRGDSGVLPNDCIGGNGSEKDPLERTLVGLQAAQAQGRRGGRPGALDDDQIRLACKLYDEHEHTVKQFIEMLGISNPAFYSYLWLKKQEFNNDSSLNSDPHH